MGGRGVCWDNVAAASFFSNFKLGTLCDVETRRFQDEGHACRETFRWIAWYNPPQTPLPCRLHAPGRLREPAPAEFNQHHP